MNKIVSLIRKDIFELLAQGRVLLVLIAVYTVFPAIGSGGAFLGGIGILLCAMLPMNTLAYDERSKWEKYALSMPVGIREIVWSKYFLGVAAVIAGAGLQSIAYLVTGQSGNISATLIVAAAALLYLAAQLPLIFRFGQEKARIWYLLLTCGVCGLFGIFFSMTEDGVASALTILQYPVVIFALALLLQIPSALLSMKLRARRGVR